MKIKKANLESITIDPCQLEKDYFSLAKYLVNDLMPYLLKKFKQSYETPDLVHYRCHVLMFNLSLHWLCLMFDPLGVNISLIEVLKVKGYSGLWSNFYSYCGQICLSRNALLNDHLKLVHDYDKGMFETYQYLNF